MRFGLSIAFLVFLAVSVDAQTVLPIYDKSVNCETSLVVQDLVVNNVLDAKDGGVLIVLVHAGTGEQSRQLTQRRIANVRRYFKNRGNRIPSERVIVAEGEKVSGLGRIDYYFNGKLSARLVFNKDQFICHSCCGPDEDYYPDKAARLSRQQRKPNERQKK